MAATPEHRVSTGERINHESPGHLQQALGAKGIRLTKQRRVLLQVMETARRHLDAAASPVTNRLVTALVNEGCSHRPGFQQ